MTATQPETEEELVEELVGLPQAHLDQLAEAAKHDLYLMCKGVLGMPDINPQTHKAYCNFLQNDEPVKKRRLGLMPRIHLKTSINVGNNIRMAVKQPDAFQGLFIGETETKAVDVLRELKEHLQKGEILRLLYPELVPEKFTGPGADWAMTRASLVRKKALKQATWTALGKGGASVGGHWTRLTVDDIIGLEAMGSPAEMKSAVNFVKNIDSLVTNSHSDIIDFTGTRWSRGDVYKFIMSFYGDELAIFRREAIENGLPIFPQKHSLKSLAHIQKTPEVWFAQYCNNPMAEGQTDFPSGAIRTFYFDNEGRVCAWVDGNFVRWKLEQLDIVMSCDPNSGSVTAEDDAAIVVSGVAPDDNIFVLETYVGRPTPSGFVDEIFRLWERWHPRAVGIEEAGQQSTRHYFEKKSEEEAVYPNMVTLKPKNREKPYRIRTALQPILASRRLFCLSSQTELRSQVEFFPDLELIDVLDALAYSTEPGMWRTPDSYEELEERGRSLRLLRNRRNRLTGY